MRRAPELALLLASTSQKESGSTIRGILEYGEQVSLLHPRHFPIIAEYDDDLEQWLPWGTVTIESVARVEELEEDVPPSKMGVWEQRHGKYLAIVVKPGELPIEGFCLGRSQLLSLDEAVTYRKLRRLGYLCPMFLGGYTLDRYAAVGLVIGVGEEL